jgi:hypothetical protein
VLATGVDLTNVLDTLIITLPALIAAFYAARIHQQIKLPSGKSIGDAVEYAHDTAIANNLMLSKHNGPTKNADAELLRSEAATGPRVPVDAAPAAQER